MMQQENRTHDRLHGRMAAGGIAFMLAALIYVGTEAISAAAWHNPPYDYAYNYISDLGVARSLTVDGREILSPLAAVMNFGFQAHGLLFVLGYVLALPLLRGKWGRLACAAAVVHGIGNFMVGYFPGESYDGVSPHVVGAGLAIVGGNLALILAGLSLRRRSAAEIDGRGRAASGRLLRFGPRLSVLGIGLGSLGLAALALMVTRVLGHPAVFERLSVYTMTAWDLSFGFCLLAACVTESRRATGRQK
ncbi:MULTISPECIES: DUF998 domain-containing protein [Saccharibacillus]|uniref:DUF998 domain-containing protein n=1 Tax=Saccharibacillus TaxID=456492 RepID=UPI00131298A2|nr:DUF998 domain-containing protein [Saccharibacillus sp. WB 17]MWJ32668.1 DUF998 domain-containing protein [Saccharibacillus sp. WB 17]